MHFYFSHISRNKGTCGDIQDTMRAPQVWIDKVAISSVAISQLCGVPRPHPLIPISSIRVPLLNCDATLVSDCSGARYCLKLPFLTTSRTD